MLTDDCDCLATEHGWIRGEDLANVDDYREEQAELIPKEAVVDMDFDLANQLVVDRGQSVESMGVLLFAISFSCSKTLSLSRKF